MHRADWLDRAAVAQALQQHGAQEGDVVAHSDSPRCTPYGALPHLNQVRKHGLLYHQACLGTVVSQRIADYRRHGQPFLVESVTRAGQFVPDGAVATHVDGADVGATDKHVFITPADRPFIRDVALAEQGVRVRAGTCAGPRPTSALHPDGVPLQNPWSTACCAGNSGPDGQSLSAWGGGTHRAPRQALCKWLGV